MAKAITVVLLLAATAALAAAQGKGATITINKGSSGNSTGSTISHPLASHLGAIHSGLSGGKDCECKDECTEQTRKVCKVTEEEEEVCRTVKGEEDIVECATRCFKASKIITIGKGRRLLSASSMAVAPHILAAKASLVHGGSKNGTTGGGDGGDGGDKPKEICREICKPAKKPTSKKECKNVPKKKYDCKDESLGTTCVKKCKCSHGVTKEIKEVPALSLHGGKGH